MSRPRSASAETETLLEQGDKVFFERSTVRKIFDAVAAQTLAPLAARIDRMTLEEMIALGRAHRKQFPTQTSADMITRESRAAVDRVAVQLLFAGEDVAAEHFLKREAALSIDYHSLPEEQGLPLGHAYEAIQRTGVGYVCPALLPADLFARLTAPWRAVFGEAWT